MVPGRECASCHTPVPAGAAFCSACGAPTPTEVGDEVSNDFEGHVRAALADRYRITRELGRGGMALVYLAEDLRHEREVAVKVLRPELAAAIGADRFVREIKLAARLNHPNILALYDSGHAGGQADRRTGGQGHREEAAASESLAAQPPDRLPAFLFFVMPYVDGESLRARLQRERQLPIDVALQLTREVAEGLDYAHERGVIHRDIKPENILLARGHALIADFGIAKAVAREGATHLTSAGTSIGTPLYMSPEQAVGDPLTDGRTDIYSLGCVLYEMLAGEPPFTGPTAHAILAKHAIDPRPSVRTVRDTVPAHVEIAIHRAMAKTPADRFGTGAAFVTALRSGGPAGMQAHPAAAVGVPEPEAIAEVVPATVAPRTAGARAVARFRVVLIGALVVGVLGFLVDAWLGAGVGPGPIVAIAALIVVALEYGRLHLAGRDWRAVVGVGGAAAREGRERGRASADWTSGEQEFGAYAEQVRRARSHRAVIVGLMAQLPRAEQELLGEVMATADHLVLAIAGNARSLHHLATSAADTDLANERQTRETRRVDLAAKLRRMLGVMERLRSDVRNVGRHGLAATRPSLDVALEDARALQN